MKKLKIMLDIWAGPIWWCYYDEKTKTYDYGIDIIKNDKEIMKLHQEIQDLFSSYYHLDKDIDDMFDFEQEKKDKEKMLALFEKLISRLNEINDGSFEIDDRETQRIRNL
ncbi:hypothetical protein [Gemella sp. zg-1178]|uniref:hypothetical protein n=1 Tax=Gemella sp. zg-1178 TaxID=2840372 RepID=UPI001C05AE4B|nr:hypothetical protein [Gemella sp. zg-1178]MBU0279126.1 hypothetical protein [Gemella sp. zg-1178]